MTNKDDKLGSLGAAASADLAAVLATASTRKSGWRWLWRLVVVAALAGGGYGYYLYSRDNSAPSYVTTTAKTGDLTVIVTATGSVEPTVQVDVSSEQSGTVREVLADFNSQVRKGEVIARLDTAKLEADVKNAEAKLQSAKATVAKTDADLKAAGASLERLKTLSANRVSTQQDLDEAQYKYDAAIATKESAEADVLSAEASLQLSRLSLSKATIISPIDGIVLSRDVDPGATVAASLEAPTLFKIAGDLRQMELQVAIDEADVGQIAVGQKASFTVDAFPDKQFPAEITAVRYASKTVNDVVTYLGILAVRNDEMLLRQGMTATADITVQAINGALLVPNAALRYTPPQTAAAPSSGGGMFSLFRPPRMGSLTAPEPVGKERTVWVLKGGVPAAVNIEIGATDGQNTVVTKGDIAPGALLITDTQTKRN
ncbi:efflux RND transporter periplasmic adaptor subunit [Rhizobium sp. RU36D]|uniref:efflux RND transporter periplasmic adaptor subunit n=1 Tax=Rhizobium sp. RU36D TaxID=1907415 RepID=UPI000A021D55|nr:efflux RND transporter periplasmic adaptor subunit [Rhizobium sp. RU36D]